MMNLGTFDSECRVTLNVATPLAGPSPASERIANAYGLKDLIGNVGEHVENQRFPEIEIGVYGGSYLGLTAYHPDSGINFNA
jgi:hypothetical protein